MVGLDIPVIPVEHQYIVTEPHPEIQKRKKDGLPEMGVLRDSDSRWYMREEAGGLILGPYEDGAPACYVDGPSKDSEYELFQEDLDRLAPHIEVQYIESLRLVKWELRKFITVQFVIHLMVTQLLVLLGD